MCADSCFLTITRALIGLKKQLLHPNSTEQYKAKKTCTVANTSRATVVNGCNANAYILMKTIVRAAYSLLVSIIDLFKFKIIALLLG